MREEKRNTPLQKTSGSVHVCMCIWENNYDVQVNRSLVSCPQTTQKYFKVCEGGLELP